MLAGILSLKKSGKELMASKIAANLLHGKPDSGCLQDGNGGHYQRLADGMIHLYTAATLTGVFARSLNWREAFKRCSIFGLISD